MSEENSDTGNRIGELLLESRSMRVAWQARRALEDARRLAEEWLRKGGGEFAAILLAETLRDFAFEEMTNASERAAHWSAAIKVLMPFVAGSSKVAKEYGYLVCDYAQDRLIPVDPRSKAACLRDAIHQLDATLKTVNDKWIRSSLLAAKSTVLRHSAYFEIRKSTRHLNLLNESERCANRAVAEFDTPVAMLELAEATWQNARFEKSDVEYAKKLREAEEHYLSASRRDHEVARFALASFYRNTYRPMEAAETYPRDTSCLKNAREQLRGSYILAEAAVQLWYQEFPSEISEPVIRDSAAMLEAALGAGFNNARIIVSLAYIRAIMKDPVSGDTVLGQLCVKPGQLWNEAMLLASTDPTDDALLQAFVVGIASSSVWTALGSYALEFRNDKGLADALYRGAVKMNPQNAVALTNLARFIGATDRGEALRLLERASNFADRRFRWWRIVRSEIEEMRTAPDLSITGGIGASDASRSIRHVKSWSVARKAFKEIEVLSPQARGQQLNNLVADIIALTGLTSFPPYRLRESGDRKPELDGYFSLGTDRYRVECKWVKEPAVPDDMTLFREKISVAGVSGLFISMNGYTRGAIEKAKDLSREVPLVLFDGEELRAVVDGLLGFDDVVRVKRSWLDRRSEPFFKVRPDGRSARSA